MKIPSLLLPVILLRCCFCFAAQFDASLRYQLNVNGLLPKPGEETEKTWDDKVSVDALIYLHGKSSSTNWTVSESLKFRDKLLDWDVKNDYARIQIAVEHWLLSRNHVTNAIVKAGTPFTGRLVAGVWFFDSPNGSPERANTIFNHIYFIHPRTADSQISDLNNELLLDKPRSVGEKWNIGFHPSHNLLNFFENSLGGPYAALIFDEVVTNKIDREVRFVGITNVYGTTCFHLQGNSNASNQSAAMPYSVSIKEDLLFPMGNSHRFWSIKHSTVGKVDGGITVGRGHETMARLNETVLQDDTLTSRSVRH